MGQESTMTYQKNKFNTFILQGLYEFLEKLNSSIFHSFKNQFISTSIIRVFEEMNNNFSI